MLYSGHDTAIAVMISGQLQLPAPGLHKTGLVDSQSRWKLDSQSPMPLELMGSREGSLSVVMYSLMSLPDSSG